MYQALYRQYRPMTFNDVIGQDHIIETIKNQIKNNNIGHAYLFSGTRGTGKTSTAKIFSRAVSCLSPIDSSPCNKCEICKGILNESIMDVVEMDAASNRGVNDIRELRDKVVYPPSYAKYKVYIIDEVHMLTQEAFNALLKTLEEPPKHLIFILATTEPERIPQTILSRCQRFDFKRITTNDIMKNMSDICTSLDVSIEEDALRIIARNSDGGMRDALSLLDQCISFTQGDIKYEDAISILGIVNTDVVFDMVDNIVSKDIEDILLSIDRMMEDGRDVNQFIKDIISHFRDLMIVKTSNNPNTLVQVDGDTMDRYIKQSRDFELDYIISILNILTEVDEKLKFSTQPRTLLEMAMIKVIREDNLSFEERLSRLEKGNFVPSKPDIKRATVENKDNNIELKSSRDKISNEKKYKNDKKQKTKSQKENELHIKNNFKDDEIDIDTIKSHWDEVINKIQKEKVTAAELLKLGNIVDFNNDMIFVEYSEEFKIHSDLVKNHTALIEKILSEHFNKDLKIRFDKEGLSFNSGTDSKEDNHSKNNDNIKKIQDFFGKDRVEIE